MTDIVRDYLSLHPDATVTELAFRLGMSVQQARLAIESVRQAPSPSETPATVIRPARRRKPKVTSETTVSVDPTGEAHRSAATGEPDAAWLAGLFRAGVVMDVYGAADYLGIDRGSVEYAVTRRKLSCVQVRSKKLFTRADLDAYRDARGTGKRSRLRTDAIVHEVGIDG